MGRSDHTSRYVNNLVSQMYFLLGDGAFPHKGKSHLYSGPYEAVWKQLLDYDNFNNHERARLWAKKHNTFLIDDSPIGKFLDSEFEGKGVYKYFRNKHATNPAKERAESGHVWRHASRLYILSLWGEVTTTVCGASDKAVYYKAELSTAIDPKRVALTMPEMLHTLLLPRKKAIETINEIPMNSIIDLKNKGRYYAAQRAICLGEQRIALHEALELASPKAITDALSTIPTDILVPPAATISDDFKNAIIEIGKPPVEALRYFIDSQQRYQIDQRLLNAAKRKPVKSAHSASPNEMLLKKNGQLEEFATTVLHRISKELGLPLEPAIKAAILTPDRMPRI